MNPITTQLLGVKLFNPQAIINFFLVRRLHNLIICEECKKEFKSLKSLAQHLGNRTTKKTHICLTTKKYYDKFLKVGNEGVCKIEGCRNSTIFVNLIEGYLKYCSHKCYNLDSEIINIRIESNKNRLVSKETKEKMSKSRILLWKDPNYKMNNPEIQKIKSEKMKINRADPNSKYNTEEWSEKMSNSMKNLWSSPNSFWRSSKFLDQVIPGRKKWMLEGGAVYISSFIKNPSKPQVELYNRIKELYSSAELNYPLYRGEGNKNYSLDVAIPELKICFESDGSWWHPNEEKDLIRQNEIEELGWKVIRYKSDSTKQVPSKEQIKNDIEKIIEEINNVTISYTN